MSTLVDIASRKIVGYVWLAGAAAPAALALLSGLKKFVVSGNPTDPSFYPRPKKFYGLICAEFFSGSISIALPDND